MNSQWINSVILATGQSIPFTGAWSNVNQSRDTVVVTFCSGVGVTSSVISVQSQTALTPYSNIFSAGSAYEGVNLTSYAGAQGYQTYATTVPSFNIRVVATGGSGQLFAYAIVQN